MTYKYIFNSIQEYYDYLTSPKALQRANARPYQESKDNTYNFTQSRSLDDALDLLRNGTNDPQYNLNPKAPVVSSTSKPCKVASTAPIGFAPHVPNALRNLPNSMVTRIDSRRTQPVPAKSITIVKDVSYAGHMNADTIRQLNLKTTEYIRSLLLAPVAPRVTVYAHIGVRYYNNDQFHIFVKLKSADQRLVIPQLNFSLCHPSFLRRCFFRFEEVCPDIFKVQGGYGSPLQEARPELLQMPNTEVQWIAGKDSLPQGVTL